MRIGHCVMYVIIVKFDTVFSVNNGVFAENKYCILYGLSESLLLPPPRLRKKPGGIDSKFNVDYELFMPQAEKLVSGGQNRDFRHFSSFFK